VVTTQLKLHAAIAAVLIDAETQRDHAPVWLTYDVIAAKIAEYGLYRQDHGRGEHPLPGQVSGRVGKYPHLFAVRSSGHTEVRLNRCEPGTAQRLEALVGAMPIDTDGTVARVRKRGQRAAVLGV
jgi:hypothetical protein